MRIRTAIRLGCLALACAFGAAARAGPESTPASAPRSNLEYWLERSESAPAGPAVQPAASNPFGRARRFRRTDALPGVVVLSDGRLLAGGVYTTREKNWEVWVPSQRRWRHVPPLFVLGIHAGVVREEMDKEWRWKEMGSDERVFTGRTRPVRRFLWRFHLIDGSTLTGTVKGQPLWVETPRGRSGPFILHERSVGRYGQTLRDLVYVKSVIISRRAMREVLGRATSAPASAPAG